MTCRGDFVKYNELKRKLEKELDSTLDSERFKKIHTLYRHNFPTKEEAIADVEAFFQEAA